MLEMLYVFAGVHLTFINEHSLTVFLQELSPSIIGRFASSCSLLSPEARYLYNLIK